MANAEPTPQPPVAPRRRQRLVAHGHERFDDWYWLKDRHDPQTLAYLEAENAYAEAVTAPLAELTERLFDQICARVPQTDVGSPTWQGGWWYYSRSFEGRQYPTLCRRPDPTRALDASQVAEEARELLRRQGGGLDKPGPPEHELDEQVLLDLQELSGGSAYFALGMADVSPDQRLVAYSCDYDGSERYTLRFRLAGTASDLDERIEGVYYGSAWDSASASLLYVRTDHAMRPWQVWRHVVGSDPGADELLFQEDDERFFVSVERCRSGQRLLITSSSKTTTETWWLDASERGSPRLLLERRPGVEHAVEHAGGGWLVLTNSEPASQARVTNFCLAWMPGDGPELRPLMEGSPDNKYESVECFKRFVVLWQRSVRDGLERLVVLPRADPLGAPQVDEAVTVDQPEEVYSLRGEDNPEWDQDGYRYSYTSLVTPTSSMELDPSGPSLRPVWVAQVNDYDPKGYQTRRLWAQSPDGCQVPISLVARADFVPDGSHPCLLYGYGAYEASVDPTFSPSRLNLLERGMVYAIAHVRGGGELGRTWYEQGRMENKANTFSDFVAAAEHLLASGWASPGGLVARGASAGGLLMGAVVNARPELFRAVVAEVPFVDVVNTMSDPDLPLTVTEWEEWGDPLHDPDAYWRMLSYSPYDNVGPKPYPAMLVTAGLNDPRVGYWEPAKWVARLRAEGAGGPGRPLLLRTELGAGHRGPSGRYDAWRDEARVQAFVLWMTGLAGPDL